MESLDKIDRKIDRAYAKIAALKKLAQEHLDAEDLFKDGSDPIERRKHAEAADAALKKIKYQEDVRLRKLKERRQIASTPSFLPDTEPGDPASQAPVQSLPAEPGCDATP